MRSEFAQNIQVTRYQKIFGDNADRIPELRQDTKTSSRQLQPSLDRLVAIGYPAHGKQLWFPFRRRQLPTQKLGSILLHHDFALEIEPG